MNKKTFLPFAQAREVARTLQLNSLTEWHAWFNPDRKLGLPSHPEKVYKKEWISWPDFLGYERQRGHGSRKHKPWAQWSDAREYVRTLGLMNSGDYRIFLASGQAELCLPTEPQFTYPQWTSWVDFLGRDGRTQWVDFITARDLVRKQGFKNREAFLAWHKSVTWTGTRLPTSPEKVYQENWVSWPDFLGHDKMLTICRKKLPFEQARAYVRQQGLKGWADWNRWYKSERPKGIPSNPFVAYPGEFAGGPDWMGYEPRRKEKIPHIIIKRS